MTLRTRVEYDPYPDCDWLEQWDTAEKYYGGFPECPRCGCGMDYLHSHLWQCSDNREEYNGSCDAPSFHWEGNETGGQSLDEQGQKLPFDAYKTTYGDYDNYVFLCAVVESKCDHCGEWSVKDSLGGITFYEYSSDRWETGTFTEAEVDAMSSGYLQDSLQGMLDEVKSQAA